MFEINDILIGIFFMDLCITLLLCCIVSLLSKCYRGLYGNSIK